MTITSSGKIVVIFGGSGFVGQHLVRVLARDGWRIKIAVRRPDLAEFLKPLGTVGQIQPIQANLRFPESVSSAVAGSNAVVNLVGILSENRNQKFAAVQAQGARVVAEASKKAGVAKLVQISAIGADENSNSVYSQTKAEGETAAFENFPDAFVVRPSIIFGPEDNFFNQFARMMRISFMLPLIGNGVTKFQPVFVGDVAEAIARCIQGEVKSGSILELGGSEVLSFRECLELLFEVTNRRRLFLPIPFEIAKMMGKLLQIIPNAPLTADQVEMLKSDNVVSQDAIEQGRTLEGIGIIPKTLATILPTYLWRFRVHGEFEQVEKS